MGYSGPNHFIEPTCAYARWALMHHFLSVCDLTKIQIGPKVTCQKLICWEIQPVSL